MKEISLTRGKIAIVDDDDYELLSRFKWQSVQNRKSGIYYALRWRRREELLAGAGSSVWMHRQILGVRSRKDLVDHINGDGLDNRRCNLRIASSSTNTANSPKCRNPKSSRFKGVSFCSQTSLWKVQITADGESHWIGRFQSESEAAVAYDNAAIRLFGSFARINNPEVNSHSEG